MLKFAAGLTVGVVLICAGYALASRNASGTMSGVNGPYVSGTTISSSAVNARLSDIETELTNSLDRSGRGGMLSALRGVDGTNAAPAFSYTSETGSGTYRIGAGDLGWAVSGAKKLELTTALFTVSPTATFSGVVSFGGAAPTTSNTTPFTSIGAGPLFANVSRSGVNTRLTANSYFDGANDKYNATGFAGMLQLGGLTSADFVFYTAPSGTGGTNATFTERLKVNESGVITGGGGGVLTMSTGVGADGSGFKHKRGVAGCTTAAAAGATCSSTVTWTTAFADANYTAVCTLDGSSGPAALVGINSKIAASLAVTITAVTAVAATATNFECIAVHD